jgi:integrase
VGATLGALGFYRKELPPVPLTDAAIRNTKPGTKPVRLFDERGLYLEVSPAGGKWWRFKYRFSNKEKRLSLGVYPEVTLKLARDRRDDARKLLANKIDPSLERRAQRLSGADRSAFTFETIAREWLDHHSGTWVSDHFARVQRRLERDIFPLIGKRPIAEITAAELLSLLRRIEQRGALETARRALINCGQVFRYAVASGRVQHDIARDLRGALRPVKTQHFAAVTDPKHLGELLRAIDGYKGSLALRCALRLAPLFFVRPGELRKAQWADVDLDAAEWRYLVTKTGTQHIVPLCRQAMEILHELHEATGGGRYLFPSARSTERPMSDNAVLAAMRRMSIAKEEMTGHGFRAVARTLLDEVLGVRPDFIEHQLAHAVRDPNGRAYNRTAHLPERREMMQVWADYLDKLKKES